MFLAASLFHFTTSKFYFLELLTNKPSASLPKGKTYTHHLRNSKMEHMANATLEFELAYNYNRFLAGVKMFTPRPKIYWNDEKMEVSLSRIGDLVTRIKGYFVTPDLDAMLQAIEDVRSWKRPLVSLGALFGWLFFVNFFALWMIPAGLAIGVFIGAPKNDGDVKKDKKEKKSTTKSDFRIIAGSREGSFFT